MSWVISCDRMDENWFKQQQKRVGVTAKDIAKRMGRDRSTVSHIYTGRIRMSLDWARVFAEVLDMPLPTILEEAGITDAETAQQMVPDFAESDAAPFVGTGPDERTARSVAAMPGERPGVDM